MAKFKWLRWLTEARDPAAQATIIILALIVLGFILVGAVTRKRKQAVRGGIVFGALGLLILIVGSDARELMRFDTLASKVLLGVLIGVVSGLIVRVVAGR
jgi:hypothetical protein